MRAEPVLSVCIVCCPAVQIELYSHVGAIRSLVDWLKAEGWSVAAVFCMDVAFVNEPSKYIAGAMQVSLSLSTLQDSVLLPVPFCLHRVIVIVQASRFSTAGDCADQHPVHCSSTA